MGLAFGLTGTRERVFYSFMMKTALALALVFSSLSSFAESYAGSVFKQSGVVSFFDPVHRKSYPLSGATPLLSSYINRLSDGDYISVDAAIDPRQNRMTISSLNYVGLQVLLGTWRADDSSYYYFNSFTQFSTSKTDGRSCAPADVRNFTYMINPSSGAWSILISGSYNSYVGSLNIISDTEAELSLFDSETGDILTQAHLTKTPATSKPL